MPDENEKAWEALVLALLAAFPGGFTKKDWDKMVEQGLQIMNKSEKGETNEPT